MTTKFENPPINELVISTYFNPPFLALRNEHIGLLWSKIRQEFPTVQQQAPVGGAEAIETIGGDFLPMPRYWFISEDEITLLQVQRNAFMLNWRRRDADYPHYDEHLKTAFDRYYRIFEDFIQSDVGSKEIKIDLCELTYINVIEACEYWSGPIDTAKVIPSFCAPELNIETQAFPAFNCAYAYPLSDDLQIRISIRDAQSAQNPNVPVLVFEIRATGRLGQVGKSNADAWYERAHDAITSCFVGMTNSDVQQTYWKPTGDSA